MIEVTEPQVWTLIGVFAATMIGVMTFLSQAATRSISSLGRELGARIGDTGLYECGIDPRVHA
ncbi:MAG: hypothetical protein ACK5LO_01420 [Leucobacter sp.]